MSAIETQLKNGAQRVSDLLENSCSSEIDKCENKMFDRCDIYQPNDLQTYFKDIQVEGCKKQGMEFSYNYPVARCQNEVNCKSKEMNRIGCAMSSLFDDSSMQQQEKSYIYTQYMGFSNSFHVAYPYRHDQFECGDCKSYNPTNRPCVMGPKNIIIAFDSTRSMDGKRLIMAQEGLSTLINSLGYGDWFQIISFHSDSQTFNGQKKLVQATSENKQKANEWVQSIKPQNNSNFEKAFDLIFDVFDNTKDDEFKDYSCLNLVLMLTDGVPRHIFFALQQQKIYWSETYTDFSSKLDLVTISYPIVRQKQNFKQLVGVYGIDVLISQFKKYDDYEQKLKQLWLQSRENCYDYTLLSECNLEQFRDNMCYNEDCTVYDSNVLDIDLCEDSVQGTWKFQSGNEGGEYASICPGTTSDDFPFCWTCAIKQKISSPFK
ncbi:hypothetical protein PPERSA_03431 [Pseudocohnilembus persalinus]|uniref:VWFA domain-containing protein n=1 Tax=Pseudocohnilembus persalinus TaxID=266149 RepID=A0A0V0QBN2_PSEPJ|nr:hypothetical protein PPERSA_03431 [Pseudocohnilembus persalinus]|eukprot:KRW99630.1 hypothetical protein PPERSA_03431 [Pseudocohnilembus persalinus]